MWSMMFEKMLSVSGKIRRADEHIAAFGVALRAFWATEPFEISVDANADTGRNLNMVVRAEPIPENLRAIAGDCIQNLRSALDHLVNALVLSNGGTPSNQNEFPVLQGPISNNGERKNFDRKVKGMRQEAKDQILSMKPYQGGDNTLWRLHEFSRTDKHVTLLSTLGSTTAINGLPPVEDQWDGNKWRHLPGAPLDLKQGSQFFVDPGFKSLFVEIVFDLPGSA
jgi:hypothetical protein